MVERSDSVPVEVLEELVAAAVLAPSSHNTQPWLFELHEGEVDLHADRIRSLPVNDPDDREQYAAEAARMADLHDPDDVI